MENQYHFLTPVPTYESLVPKRLSAYSVTNFTHSIGRRPKIKKVDGQKTNFKPKSKTINMIMAKALLIDDAYNIESGIEVLAFQIIEPYDFTSQKYEQSAEPEALEDTIKFLESPQDFDNKIIINTTITERPCGISGIHYKYVFNSKNNIDVDLNNDKWMVPYATNFDELIHPLYRR